MSKTKRYRIRKALGGEKPGVRNQMQQFMLKAEQGMQQPSPEEMAMMQQQQQEQMLQQQGAGQPQENPATAAIMQGMEENVTPPNIIMQLLSSGVSEDDIVRGFVEVSLAKLQQSGQEVDQQMTQEMLTQFEDLVGMVSLNMQEGSQEQPAEMSKGGYKKKLLKEAKEGREMQTETPGSILPQPATLNTFIEGVKDEGNEFYAKEMADMNYSDESEMFRKGGEKWKTRKLTNRRIARDADKSSDIYERSDRKALRKGLRRGDFDMTDIYQSIDEGKSLLPESTSSNYRDIYKDLGTMGADYLGSMMPKIFSHRNTANEFSREGTGLEDSNVDIYFKKKGLGRREWGIAGLRYDSLPGFGGTLGTSGVGTTRTIGSRVIPGVTATEILIKDINKANDDSDRALKLKNNPPNDGQSEFDYFKKVLNDLTGDPGLIWDSTANKWVDRPEDPAGPVENPNYEKEDSEEFDVDVTSDPAIEANDDILKYTKYAEWKELMNSNPPTVGQTYDDWLEKVKGQKLPEMKVYVWDGKVWKKKKDNDDGASTDIKTQTDLNDPNTEALQNQENVNVDEVLNNTGYEVVADNEVTEVSADNFGVTDDMTFSQAYRTAKDAGATTFTWQGKEYGTKSFSEMPQEYQDEHRDSKWHPDNVGKSKKEKAVNAWMKKAPRGRWGVIGKGKGFGWDELGEGGTEEYIEYWLEAGYSKEEIINDIFGMKFEDRENVRKWLDSYPGWRENTMAEKKKRAKEINKEATEQNKKVLDNKHAKNAKTKDAAIEYFKRAYPDYTKNPKKYKIVDKGNGRWNLDRAAGGNMKQYSPRDYNRSAFPNLAFGGSVSPDLYKYIYGGDEMDPDMYKDITDPYMKHGGPHNERIRVVSETTAGPYPDYGREGGYDRYTYALNEDGTLAYNEEDVAAANKAYFEEGDKSRLGEGAGTHQSMNVVYADPSNPDAAFAAGDRFGDKWSGTMYMSPLSARNPVGSYDQQLQAWSMSQPITNVVPDQVLYDNRSTDFFPGENKRDYYNRIGFSKEEIDYLARGDEWDIRGYVFDEGDVRRREFYNKLKDPSAIIDPNKPYTGRRLGSKYYDWDTGTWKEPYLKPRPIEEYPNIESYAPGGAFKKPKMDPVLGPTSPSPEIQKYRETVYPTSKGVFGQIKDHFKTAFEPITQGKGLRGVLGTVRDIYAPEQFKWLSHKSGDKDAAFGYIGVDGLPNTIAQPYGSAQFDSDGNRIVGANMNLKYKDKKIGKDRLNVTWTPNKNTFDDDGKIDSSEYVGFKDYYTGEDSGFLNKDNFNEGGQNIYSGLDKFFMAGEIDTDFMGDQDAVNMNLVENTSDDDFNLEDCTEAELQRVGSDCYNAAVKSEKFKVNTARKTNNPLIANTLSRIADFTVDRGVAADTRRQKEFDFNKQTSDAKVSNISTDINQGFDAVTGYQSMVNSQFNDPIESSSARPSSINYFGARGGQYRVGGVYDLTPQQIDAIYAAGGSIEIIE